MLVISRKQKESILIGDDIEITITEIGPDRVKIGINAPKEVSILRKELAETSQMNAEAAEKPQMGSIADLKKLLP
ncbi:MAG: carbon storage regulator CsrA [Anaerofustis sp.]|jgi:carbon storage regulator